MMHAHSPVGFVLRNHFRKAGFGCVFFVTTLCLTGCGGGGAAAGADNASSSIATENSENSSAGSAPLNINCATGYGNDSLIRAPSLIATPTLYQASHLNANKNVDVEIIANVTFTADNGVKGLSNPLRLELWAVPQGSIVGASGISGHMIFRTQMITEGGAGPNQDQMESDSHVTAYLTGQGMNPPVGDYCYVVALQMEYPDSLRKCQSSDKYCPRGWYMFKQGRRLQ